MKIERLIKELQELQKDMPGAEIRLNDHDGTEALFALAVKNAKDVAPHLQNVVWIDGKDDIDLDNEIYARFENAAEEQMDEIDFFMDLIELGITLEEIKQVVPEKYEYSYNFMKEHGLI